MATEEKIYLDLMLHANALRRFITNYKNSRNIHNSLNDIEILKEISHLSTAFTWHETIEGEEYWYLIFKTSNLLTEAIVNKSKIKYKKHRKEIEDLLYIYKIHSIGNEHLNMLLKQLKRYMKYRLKNILDEKSLTLNL